MAVTRLGLGGYGVRRYGSFGGKTPDSGSGPHPVGVVSRLALDGYGARRYGLFSGKTPDTAPVVPIVPVPSGTGGGGVRYISGVPTPLSRVKGRRHKEDDDRRRSLERLEAAIAAAVEQIEGRSEEQVVPEIVQALPAIDWDEIERNRQVFADTRRRLESVLEELKAYELLAQQIEDEDTELLLM